MRILIILLCLFISSPARAMGMCMPTYPTTTNNSSVTYKNIGDGNGLFHHGPFGSAPRAYGESWCSAASTLAADNFDTLGAYCWCRLTRIQIADGYTVPYNGEWVLRLNWGYVDNCKGYCAVYCSDTGRDGPERKRVMFISRHKEI